MKTGIALFCLFGLTLLFEIWRVPNPIEEDFFPLSDSKTYQISHVYFIFEHLFLIGIIFLFWTECREKSKDYVLMFLFLQVLDFLDYLLRFNDPMFKIGITHVTFNMVFVVLYGIFLIVKAWRTE